MARAFAHIRLMGVNLAWQHVASTPTRFVCAAPILNLQLARLAPLSALHAAFC